MISQQQHRVRLVRLMARVNRFFVKKWKAIAVIRKTETLQPIPKRRGNQQQSGWGGGDSSRPKNGVQFLGTTRVSARPLSRLTQVYEQLNDCRAAIANHKVLLGHIFLAAAGLGFMTCVWVCLLRRGSSHVRRPRAGLLLPVAPRRLNVSTQK